MQIPIKEINTIHLHPFIHDPMFWLNNVLFSLYIMGTDFVKNGKTLVFTISYVQMPVFDCLIMGSYISPFPNKTF